MTADNTAEIQRGRPFEKGVSGNPTGRPRGSRNATTLALEALLDGQANALTQKAIDLALGGDMAALRLCLDAILPPRKGDQVICAEWFDDGPPPTPRWYGDELRRAMTSSAYEQINRSIDRVAGAKRDCGFAPFPSIAEDQIKKMTDNELTHAILGVRT